MIAVAQVVEDLKIGGLERVIENIALYLNPQLFKVYVLCLSKGGAIADRLIEKNKNVEILHISNYHNFLGLLKTVRWLKRKEIDIVHTHAYPAGVLGRLAAIIAQVPYIFHHQHSTYYDLNKRNYFIERFLSGFTHKVICCSEAVKRFVLEKEGISEDKVVVVYNGVPEPKPLNPSGITGLRKALGIRGENKIVSCVGSLTQHKGHEYLLHAFKEVKNAYLLLIGDGPLRKKLESKVYELGLSERVVFIGYKIDVIPYMQLTDLIVLPSSEREGLGMSLLEAMALSKPVVATNIGGVPEVVDDGSTGILVQPQASDELAKAINSLLNSPELTLMMVTNGRKKYLKKFTLNDMIKKLEAMYEGCNPKKI